MNNSILKDNTELDSILINNNLDFTSNKLVFYKNIEVLPDELKEFILSNITTCDFDKILNLLSCKSCNDLINNNSLICLACKSIYCIKCTRLNYESINKDKIYDCKSSVFYNSNYNFCKCGCTLRLLSIYMFDFLLELIKLPCINCKKQVRIDKYKYHINNDCIYRKVNCFFCNETIIFKDLKSHFITKSQEALDDNYKKNKTCCNMFSYNCHYCNKIFTNLNNLINHINICRHSLNKCKYCELNIINKEYFLHYKSDYCLNKILENTYNLKCEINDLNNKVNNNNNTEFNKNVIAETNNKENINNLIEIKDKSLTIINNTFKKNKKNIIFKSKSSVNINQFNLLNKLNNKKDYYKLSSSFNVELKIKDNDLNSLYYNYKSSNKYKDLNTKFTTNNNISTFNLCNIDNYNKENYEYVETESIMSFAKSTVQLIWPSDVTYKKNCKTNNTYRNVKEVFKNVDDLYEFSNVDNTFLSNNNVINSLNLKNNASYLNKNNNESISKQSIIDNTCKIPYGINTYHLHDILLSNNNKDKNQLMYLNSNKVNIVNLKISGNFKYLNHDIIGENSLDSIINLDESGLCTEKRGSVKLELSKLTEINFIEIVGYCGSKLWDPALGSFSVVETSIDGITFVEVGILPIIGRYISTVKLIQSKTRYIKISNKSTCIGLSYVKIFPYVNLNEVYSSIVLNNNSNKLFKDFATSGDVIYFSNKTKIKLGSYRLHDLYNDNLLNTINNSNIINNNDNVGIVASSPGVIIFEINKNGFIPKLDIKGFNSKYINNLLKDNNHKDIIFSNYISFYHSYDKINWKFICNEYVNNKELTTISLNKSFKAKYLKLEAEEAIGISYFSYK